MREPGVVETIGGADVADVHPGVGEELRQEGLLECSASTIRAWRRATRPEGRESASVFKKAGKFCLDEHH